MQMMLLVQVRGLGGDRGPVRVCVGARVCVCVSDRPVDRVCLYPGTAPVIFVSRTALSLALAPGTHGHMLHQEKKASVHTHTHAHMHTYLRSDREVDRRVSCLVYYYSLKSTAQWTVNRHRLPGDV